MKYLRLCMFLGVCAVVAGCASVPRRPALAELVPPVATYGGVVVHAADPSVCAVIDTSWQRSARAATPGAPFATLMSAKYQVMPAMESALAGMGHEVVARYGASYTNGTAFVTRKQRETIAVVVDPSIQEERSFVGKDGVAVDVCLRLSVLSYPAMEPKGSVDVWGRGTTPYAVSRRVDYSQAMLPQARRLALQNAVRNAMMYQAFGALVEN